MLKIVLFTFILSSITNAMTFKKVDDGVITLQEISSKPPSRAKNFLIWQYLKQDISSSDAKKAYHQVTGNSYKIDKEYLKKTDDVEMLKKQKCQSLQNLVDIKEYECLKDAFNISKLFNMSHSDREKLISRLKTQPSRELVNIIEKPYSQESFKKYLPNTVLSFFNYSKSFRRENLNIYLDKDYINTLNNSWMISNFVKNIVNDDKLFNLQKSLLNLDGEKLNSQTNFFLALNHLKYNQKKEAIKKFRLSLEKAKYKIDRDKNYFWLYQVTKNKKFLDALVNSNDINIYSLYGNELTNTKQKNYFTTLRTGFFNSNKDLNDPFVWHEIIKQIKNTPKDKLFDLAEDEFSQKNMVPVQNFILERAYDYNVHGFIMPYDKYMQNISVDEKALIYAIMRQESNFIPSAISRSFALGLMQLMPFLVDSLSKEFKEDINYKDMFIPQNNIKYALKHIKWMRKSLYHPLFIAYAYNGGMGFFKRHLLSNDRFNSGKYEPFLSMELMSNSQSREYGKKVLANYIIYKRILGEDVSVISLLEKLSDPKKTDNFR